MTSTDVTSDQKLIQSLFMARRNGLTGLDLSSLEIDREVGLDLQLSVLDRFLEEGDDIGGWKISYTSGRARDRMGKEYRPFGFLPESRTLPSGVTIPLSRFANLAIEPELCLVLSAPLCGEIGPAAAQAAVGEIRPAFELNEKRTVNDADQPTILADGCGAWGIVTGEGGAVRDGLVDTTVQLFQNGVLIKESTPGASMDDPFLSLARLSAKLNQHGRGLERGQQVITGSFSRALIDGPGQWTAVFGDIGTVTVTLT